MAETTDRGRVAAVALSLAEPSPLWSKRSLRRAATAQATEEPYTLVADIAHAVVADPDGRWISGVFERAELALQSPVVEVIDIVVIGFWESVQNIASHVDSRVAADAFVPLLGPSSRRAWDALNALWAAAAAEPPQHGKPDEYAEVDNPALRRMMHDMYRRMPDGQYVSVPTVLIWEAERLAGPHFEQIRRRKQREERQGRDI